MITEISLNYNWSRDYALLAEIMKEESIICLVHGTLHKTIYYSYWNCQKPVYEVSCPGTSMIYSRSHDDFIQHCEHHKLEYLPFSK